MQGLGFKAPGSGVVFAVGVFLLLCSAAESPASQQPIWPKQAKHNPKTLLFLITKAAIASKLRPD